MQPLLVVQFSDLFKVNNLASTQFIMCQVVRVSTYVPTSDKPWRKMHDQVNLYSAPGYGPLARSIVSLISTQKAVI